MSRFAGTKKTTRKTSNIRTKKPARLAFLIRLRSLPKPLLFALLFAVVAGGFFLYRSFASDGLPTKANELIISYEIGMPHQQFEDNFPTAMPPAMLLYGNGLMLCGDIHDMKPGQTHNAPLSFRQRQLSRSEVVKLVNKVKKTHDLAANLPVDVTKIHPSATGRFIKINSTDGAVFAALSPSQQNPDFSATESLLKSECGKATIPFNPDDVVAETILLPSSHKEAKNAKTELPTGVDVATKAKESKSKRFKGSQAKDLKTKLTREAKIYKQGNKIVRARYVIKMPEYKAMVEKEKSSAGKVIAAAQYPTRWLVVVPQGVATPSWASGTAGTISNNVRSWYQARVGKTFDISEVAVVRGAKSAAQYAVCPSGANCQGYASLATFYNMQNEFKRDGTSTNILAAFNTGNGCMGWGGPVNQTATSTGSSYGFAVTPVGAGSCDWSDGQHIVAAHEGGHSFGLAHTCDANIMGSCGYAQPTFWNIGLEATQTALLRDKSLYFNTVAAPPPPVVTSREHGAMTARADFNGDKKTDIAAFYDYGNSNTSIFVFTSSGSSFTPKSVWGSGSGNYSINSSRLMAGDVNGDGKSDLVSVYDYTSSNLGIFHWLGKGDGTFEAPKRVWLSGANNFDLSRSQFMSGDFDGDGKWDLAAAYNYGNSNTGIIRFKSTGTGYTTSYGWMSGAGNYEYTRSRFMAGDANADGKTDVLALYDYGNSNLGIFQWDGVATGGLISKRVYTSGNGNFDLSRSKWTVGDFNGDGKVDLGAFYDYGGSNTGTILYTSNGSGFTSKFGWFSGAGSWDWSRSRVLAGDYNGDGRADMGAIYDYGGANTSIFQWISDTNGVPQNPSATWKSGPGNWSAGSSMFTD